MAKGTGALIAVLAALALMLINTGLAQAQADTVWSMPGEWLDVWLGSASSWNDGSSVRLNGDGSLEYSTYQASGIGNCYGVFHVALEPFERSSEHGLTARVAGVELVESGFEGEMDESWISCPYEEGATLSLVLPGASPDEYLGQVILPWDEGYSDAPSEGRADERDPADYLCVGVIGGDGAVEYYDAFEIREW